jgi:hypothetical protein
MGAVLVGYICLTQALAVLVPFENHALAFWGMQWMATLGLGLFYGSLFGALSELVPTQIRASLVALALFAWEGIGTSIAQALSGHTIDALQSWPGMGHKWPLLIPEVLRFGPITLVTLMTCVPVGMGTITFFFWARRYERDREVLLQNIVLPDFKR